MHGVFITFEGIDGCGKTSLAEAILAWLKAEGKKVLLTREPTETWLGDAVKRGISENHPALTEAFLFMADRASHTRQIYEWLKQGKVVLCDRYADSTVSYQAASLALEGFKGDPLTWLKGIGDMFVLTPNLTILLDIEPELALQRIQSRPRKTKFEMTDFLKSVRGNFLRLGRGENRIRVIDASKPLDRVVEETKRNVSSVL